MSLDAIVSKIGRVEQDQARIFQYQSTVSCRDPVTLTPSSRTNRFPTVWNGVAPVALVGRERASFSGLARDPSNFGAARRS